MLPLNKARVTIFIPTLGGGGAERLMLNLAKTLKHYYRVSLIVSKRVSLIISKVKGPYVPDVRALDLKLVDLGCRCPRATLVPFERYAVSAFLPNSGEGGASDFPRSFLLQITSIPDRLMFTRREGCQ